MKNFISRVRGDRASVSQWNYTREFPARPTARGAFAETIYSALHKSACGNLKSHSNPFAILKKLNLSRDAPVGPERAARDKFSLHARMPERATTAFSRHPLFFFSLFLYYPAYFKRGRPSVRPLSTALAVPEKLLRLLQRDVRVPAE